MLRGRRRRVLSLGLGIGVAALVAGCGPTGSSSSSSSNTVTAKGSTMVVYLSRPSSPDAVETQVFEAEQLGCQQLTGAISGSSLSVKCQTVSDAKLSDNARAAIQNESSIAYIGEITPGDSQQTIGITNALDIPQLSPTDTAPVLDSYYEAKGTYGTTFARVAPNTSAEASAVLAEMKRLHVRSVFVKSDGSAYGDSLANALRSGASAEGITVNNSETAVDAIFYAGNSPTAAASFAAGASSTATSTKLFLPAALAGLQFGSGDWSRFGAVYVSQPGASASAAKSFVSQFTSRYGAPGPQAAYGYATIQVLVHALDQAGKSANSRTTVVKNLRKLSNVSTVVGPVSINSSGESSLGPNSFVFSRLVGGQLVPLAGTTR